MRTISIVLFGAAGTSGNGFRDGLAV